MGKKLLILFLCAFMAPLLHSSPRWWWDDATAHSAPINFEATLPAIAVPAGDDPAGGTGGETPVFISFAQGGEVFLTASFDGGCSFCDAVQVTATAGSAEVNRAIAVGYASAGEPRIALAYYRDGNVFVSASDFSRVPPCATTGPLSYLCCEALTSVDLQWIEVQLSSRPANDNIDIVAVGGYDHPPLQFHAVWDGVIGSNRTIFYINDRTDDGYQWGGAGDVGVTDVVQDVNGDYFAPSLSADDLDDPACSDGDFAINIAFGANLPLPVGFGVLYLRSTDSGDTFSSDGSWGMGPPAMVSDILSLEPGDK